MKDGTFKKSTFSPIAGGVWCVEVQRQEDCVLVRDSKQPKGSVLAFSVQEWDAFTKGVKNNEFDV